MTDRLRNTTEDQERLVRFMDAQAQQGLSVHGPAVAKHFGWSRQASTKRLERLVSMGVAEVSGHEHVYRGTSRTFVLKVSVEEAVAARRVRKLASVRPRYCACQSNLLGVWL